LSQEVVVKLPIGGSHSHLYLFDVTGSHDGARDRFVGQSPRRRKVRYGTAEKVLAALKKRE